MNSVVKPVSAINSTEPPYRSVLQEGLDALKKYKELVVLVASIVGGTFVVRDYFATKEEVEILKCQAENGISYVRSRIESDQLMKMFIEIEKSLKVSGSGSKTKDVSDLARQQIERDQLRARMNHEQGKQMLAEENLRPGFCEKSVRKK